jgi:hypothetical protein
MKKILVTNIGLNYPRNAAAAAEIVAAGGVKNIPDAWDRLMKRVEPCEECSDLPAGPMRDWLIEMGHVVELGEEIEEPVIESPKGGGKKG